MMGLSSYGSRAVFRRWRLLLAAITVLCVPPVVPARAEPAPPNVLCLGDSLTAGLGLPIEQAWPALVQRNADAEGLPARLINAGVSGETTAGGRRRLDWLLTERVDILILALGANDGLRGLATGELDRNLQAIIDTTRKANPDLRVIVAGMQAPPNMGPDYAAAFSAVFPRVAARNNAILWPFMLEGVGGVPDLNLDDGIHPNAEGHRRMADMAWTHLRPLLAPSTVP